MTSYNLGERVWAMVDGFPWWPAKVVSADEKGTEVPEGYDVCVEYYGTHDIGFFISTDAEHIVPFEESSEKAVTSDEGLTAALEECVGDLDAADLREDAGMSLHQSGATSGSRGAGKTQKLAGRKRNRSPGATKKKKHATTAGGGDFSEDDDNEGLQQTEFSSASNSQLIELKNLIDRAASENDIPTLRAALLQCAGIQVTFDQLKSTKIGVSVGDLFSKPELGHVQALVRAIVCFWAMAMPQETRAALEQMQQLHAHHGGEASFAVATRQPTATATQGAGVVEAIRKSFSQFPAELASLSVDDARLIEVAQKINDALETVELKKRAIGHLRRPGHDALRSKLLVGAMSPQDFAVLVPDDLLTVEEEQAKAAKEALVDHSAVLDGSYSEMFECPKCEKFRATFFEKQIRSADEPATIFLTCLECKNQWTLN